MFCRGDPALENGPVGDGSEAAAADGAPGAAAAEDGEQAHPVQNGGTWTKEDEHAREEVAAKFQPGIKFKIAT